MAGRRSAPMTQEVSPLRAARQLRNLTLEAVCEHLDLLDEAGNARVTPSMLSGWELGRHRTSPRNRDLLCALYDQRPDTLFAHQDRELAAGGETPRLLAGYQALSGGLLRVVTRSVDVLVVAGSRSRDANYLEAIEDALRARPGLVHYRVLFGHPHHQILKDHLQRLLELRDPADRSQGYKTLHIGIVEDTITSPERFLCASETEAVHPIASLTSSEAFDSGVVLGPRAAERLVDHIRGCYAGSRKIESPEDIGKLQVVRNPR